MFRGFADELVEGSTSDGLVFTTDSFSAKCDEIRMGNGVCEGCWMFPETWDQMRFRGQLRIVSEGILYSSVWEGLSNRTRGSFFRDSTHVPGLMKKTCSGANGFGRKGDGGVCGNGSALGGKDVGVSAPPGTFAVLVLEIERVEHVCVKTADGMVQRHRWKREGSTWSEKESLYP